MKHSSVNKTEKTLVFGDGQTLNSLKFADTVILIPDSPLIICLRESRELSPPKFRDNAQFYVILIFKIVVTGSSKVRWPLEVTKPTSFTAAYKSNRIKISGRS